MQDVELADPEEKRRRKAQTQAVAKEAARKRAEFRERERAYAAARPSAPSSDNAPRRDDDRFVISEIHKPRNVSFGTTETEAKLEEEVVESLALANVSLMEISKQISCEAGKFFARARSHPEELKKIYDSDERGASPVHHFLRNCKKITAKDILEVAKLGGSDDSSPGELFHRRATKGSMMGSTPVHWLFRWGDLRQQVIVALHESNEGSLRVRDWQGRTPIDYYFDHRADRKKKQMEDSKKQNGPNWMSHGSTSTSGSNSKPRLFETDQVTHFLCRHASWWGIDALARSPSYYTAQHDLPSGYEVLINGSQHEVHKFMHHAMKGPFAHGKFKYIVSLIPLRKPTRYGMTVDDGLEYNARVWTSAVDNYADEKSTPQQKTIWLATFVEVLTW